FFFQAEDGIRDPLVTGVQTCALPIFAAQVPRTVAWRVLTDYDSLGRFVRSIEASHLERQPDGRVLVRQTAVGGPFLLRRHVRVQIGRASCRDRGEVPADDAAWRRDEE